MKTVAGPTPGRWLLVMLLAAPAARADVLLGNPSNYRQRLTSMSAGDTLQLDAGVYTQGLPIVDKLGQPGLPIVITGPASGAPAVFEGSSSRNTVSLVRSGYIEIRNLRLDGLGLEGDGVKAEGESGNFAHHITLEGLTIVNHGANQQIVGINTKCPTWDWVIRRNTVQGAGTGIYLGNSDGSSPFVNGLIEYNLVVDTVGYNMQVKHQIDRPNLPGLPRNGSTIIRHNVFSKANNGSSGDDARPCLLVGHWPLAGDGANDVYQIYGNFFWQNPNEALFQGEGNIALYDNLFVQDFGLAVNVQPHNDVPRSIRVFHNTVLASGTGIRVTGGNSSFTQKVIGNAVFAASPIQAADQQDNITGTRATASSFLTAPNAALGTLDLFPLEGQLTGSAVDTSLLQGFVDWDRDFNGAVHPATMRGAYGSSGQNPGWLPQLEVKRAPSVGTATPTQSVPTPTRTPATGVPASGASASILVVISLLLAVTCMSRRASPKP